MKNQVQVLRPREVCNVLSVSRTTLWRRIRDGSFPAPLRLSDNIVGWRLADVERWLAERPTA